MNKKNMSMERKHWKLRPPFFQVHMTCSPALDLSSSNIGVCLFAALFNCDIAHHVSPIHWNWSIANVLCSTRVFIQKNFVGREAAYKKVFWGENNKLAFGNIIILTHSSWLFEGNFPHWMKPCKVLLYEHVYWWVYIRTYNLRNVRTYMYVCVYTTCNTHTHTHTHTHTLSGGAPNYFPNSFSGPVDNPSHSLSKTTVVL